ncbi:MlaD family protein [Massilia psychrophila]|uniref:MCE family protein n=1 Tax=Massilia psychrophila TaxID=1603353 RepID=A0A2G8SWE2_9BURK|nr:MlaD family protein [Massilia psychrophila]PIL38107.1 MCE family protein [Massilia psychrophila]GGE91114.1 ABC transporter substrate-binding protein [Massilia psychrophila]
MENRSHALMTGFFTIALLIAAVLAGIWFNRDSTERVPYLIATTESIPGLNPQAAVRYRGLEVGRVDDISFNPAVAGQIIIRLSVDPKAPVTETTFATLGYQGVTGIAFIQLDDEKTGSPLLKSDTAQVAAIPLRQGLLDQLEKRGLVILQKTEEITSKVNAMLGPDNQKLMTDAFTKIGKTAEAYAQIPKQLEPTLKRLPELTDKAAQSMASLNELSASATRTTKNFDKLATTLQAPDGPIQRMAETIDRVGGSLEGVTSELELQTLPHVVAMTDEARTALRAVKRTATSLSDRPQGLLFGSGNASPGPGEPGFVAPTK